MKVISSLVIGVASIVLLNSCCLMTARTNYQQTCNPDFFAKNQCGTAIVGRCHKVCHTCTFNEPQCSACWACVNHQNVGGTCVYNDL